MRPQLSEADALAGERARSEWASNDARFGHSVMATQGFRAGWRAALEYAKEQHHAE